MKFPLKERPFDLVRLSPERYADLERLAQDVVDANLREFHDFVHLHNRVLPTNQYKAIKKRDKVTVYKQLTHRSERVFGPLGRRMRSDAPLILPKLVVTGTVRGRMEDMLLGTAVRDPASVVVKTSYVDDEIVDCSVLHELQGASEEDPFRFLALKWIVKSKVQGVNSVIVPRDMIVMQSSGLLAEEGIGYHLLHSVDAEVPECPPLDSKFSILRSRTSTMFIFRQLTADIIEIYTANYVEPNGSAPEAVAIASAAKSLSSSWKSLECAYNMKLSWILKNKEAYMGSDSHAEHLNTGSVCELCTKKATLTGRLDDCSLCDARVCSRCRDTKSLAKANRRLELKVEKHEFCKTCLFRAVNEDSARIAAEMNVGVPITPWRKLKDASSRKFSYASSHSSGHGSSRGRRGQTHRDTMSTATSSSGHFTERERDLDSLGYSKIFSKDSQRTASIATSAYTDLDFDNATDDGMSVDENEEAWERQQYQAYLAQQKELRKRKLQEEYLKQLQEIEGSDGGNQIAPYTKTPHNSSRGRSPTSTKKGPPTKEEVEKLKNVDFSQDHFKNLYAQMKSLQIAAEKTFELTRDNERKLSQGSQRKWTEGKLV